MKPKKAAQFMIRLSTFAFGASVFGVLLALGACAPVSVISPATTAKVAVVSTLAGGGTAGFADDTGTKARFRLPIGVAVDTSGIVYVADTDNHRIRKITKDGVVSTLAGTGEAGFADGTGTKAIFNAPMGVAVDKDGNVYVADQENHRIRKITFQ